MTCFNVDGWSLIAGSVLPDDASLSGTYPSARVSATTWSSGTDLYLYGGAARAGATSGMSDFWRFVSKIRMRITHKLHTRKHNPLPEYISTHMFAWEPMA